MPDDRSKREKLEAMANQSASPREAEVAKRKLHVLFKRRGGGSRWEDTHVLPQCSATRGGRRCVNVEGHGGPHWTGRAGDQWGAATGKGGDPKPHIYERVPGHGDEYGCAVCGRSKDNPHAHHVKAIS